MEKHIPTFEDYKRNNINIVFAGYTFFYKGKKCDNSYLYYKYKSKYNKP